MVAKILENRRCNEIAVEFGIKQRPVERIFVVLRQQMPDLDEQAFGFIF
jgi:hypothetical protein